MIIDYREQPCARCPWRADVDPAVFSDADMAKLTRANGTAGAEAPPNSPTMSCHLDQPDTAHPMRLCAGWLAVVGRHHLGIRMALIDGRLPDQAVIAGDGWPTLRTSLASSLRDRATAMPLHCPAHEPAHVLADGH